MSSTFKNIIFVLCEICLKNKIIHSNFQPLLFAKVELILTHYISIGRYIGCHIKIISINNFLFEFLKHLTLNKININLWVILVHVPFMFFIPTYHLQWTGKAVGTIILELYVRWFICQKKNVNRYYFNGRN